MVHSRALVQQQYTNIGITDVTQLQDSPQSEKEVFMRGKASIILMVCLLAVLCASASWAQAEDVEQKSQLIWMREIAVKPSMASEYVEAMKDYIALCKEQNYPFPFSVWGDGNFNYFYVYPVDDYQGPMTIYDASSEMLKKWGVEKAQNYENAMRTSISSYKDYFVEYLPAYSYIPENPRLKDEDMNYAIWDIVHIPLDKEAEYLKLVKEGISLMKNKNIDEPLLFYSGRLGTKRPFYFSLGFGKDAADFWTANEKMWEQLGEEGGELYQKFMKLITKREFKQFWQIKSLSYQPEIKE
jgi:hypothetical protein